VHVLLHKSQKVAQNGLQRRLIQHMYFVDDNDRYERPAA
jgi:hypothetical protein